jgi:hypothetical protein
MLNKSFIKFGAAFVALAALLIFLGVNYVPRIFASSSSQGNIDVAEKQTHLLHTHYTSEQYQQRIALQLSYVKSDWIERHPSNYYSNSDWIERHPVSITQALFLAGADWIERHPSNYYSNSDWIERHPSMSNYIRPIGTERFFTPPPISIVTHQPKRWNAVTMDF